VVRTLAARTAGLKVIYLQFAYREDLSNAAVRMIRDRPEDREKFFVEDTMTHTGPDFTRDATLWFFKTKADGITDTQKVMDLLERTQTLEKSLQIPLAPSSVARVRLAPSRSAPVRSALSRRAP
jgi:hypothetical protein